MILCSQATDLRAYGCWHAGSAVPYTRHCASASSSQSRHCMYAGICNMFERDLKERNSHQRELTYDVQQLFQWIDHLVHTHSLDTLCHSSEIVLHRFFYAAIFRGEKPDSMFGVCAARPLSACVSPCASVLHLIHIHRTLTCAAGICYDLSLHWFTHFPTVPSQRRLQVLPLQSCSHVLLLC